MFQLRFQSRSEASGPPVVPIPALEQKISIRPTALVTVSTMNFTWDSLETSQQKKAPRPSSSSLRTLKPLSSSTSAQPTRRAPSLANLRQSARPIPLAPPVTTTTFPLICMRETILTSPQIFKPSPAEVPRGARIHAGKLLIYGCIICSCTGVRDHMTTFAIGVDLGGTNLRIAAVDST